MSARCCATCRRIIAVPANNPNKRYCSPRCRVADWHHRHDRPAGAATDDEQREPAANAVGNDVPMNDVPGAAPGASRCPHCGQPVAVVSLLVPPAAAHVRIPEASDA
jgi:endogenous inhibitor of DNA gyrase (YacG/DUF329 family)